MSGSGDDGTLHVYAVTREGPPLELRGIDDAVVERIRVDGLDAIASRHGAAPAPTKEALVRHDAVCSALLGGGAVVPIRFGAAFSDRERLRSEIAERKDDLRATLTRVDGQVELGVRVARTPPPEGGSAASGSEYLHRRLEERRAALRAAEGVDGRLRALATDRRARTLETPALVLSASYLVPRDAVDRFQAEVAALERENADLTLVCTGPWPPYSFAGGKG